VPDNLNDVYAYLAQSGQGVFEQVSLSLFRYQWQANALYQAFCNSLRRHPDNVEHLLDIPFLPIDFFKTREVRTGNWEQPELVFESSGTTGEIPSRHLLRNAALYERSLLSGFTHYYGNPADYVFLALLPSYLERSTSSLVHMARSLMEISKRPESGFYLNNLQRLAETIEKLEAEGQKTLLLGVTFALLDMAEAYPMQLRHTLVMETGGMKGRREEWTRSRVHDFLKERWGLESVHSEYGMTELLSQAYAPADGIFRPAASMKVLVRELNDPLAVSAEGQGALNIVDLFNVHSCAFIATDDLGRVQADGRFEVLGRCDHSALRGCSLMVV
jgi:phenylacetate-coenzyme A ligase PaaK-like adenylate-forming protein